MKVGKCRGIATILAFCMLALACSGCGSAQKKNADVDLSGEIPETLTIFSRLGGTVSAAGGTTYNDVLTFQLLEEKTGCHVEWIHPAGSAATERFNMMMVSGEYPEVICYDWANAPGGLETYVEDGVIVDLTPYIEECMPNFSKILEEYPEFKRDVVNDEGKIYTIPGIRLDLELGRFQGPVIRQDWLDKLGLDAPKTPEDLYEVLKAFKTQDPNGNGAADEMPMGGTKFNNVNGIGPLLWMFGAHWDLQVKNGEVVYGPMTEEFKKGMAYVAQLYSEGLIDPDYLLDTRAKVDAKFTSDTMGFAFGFQPTTYYPTMNDGTREVKGIGFPAADGSDNYCFNSSYAYRVNKTAAFAVTCNNENVAGTLKWLDELYGGEGLMYANYGKEGVSYEMVEGKPVFTDYINNPDNGKTTANMVALTCGVRDSSFPMVTTWQYYKQTLAPWGIQAVEAWHKDDPNLDGIVPQISLTAEESSTYTNIMSKVETFMLEEANKVVTGRSSIDNWDNVIAEIQKMGVDEAMEAQNAAYKRYLAR